MQHNNITSFSSIVDFHGWPPLLLQAFSIQVQHPTPDDHQIRKKSVETDHGAGHRGLANF